MKVFSNQSLEFSNGEETAQIKQGFDSCPDWVEETPYFQAALSAGIVQTFESVKEGEKIEKAASEKKTDKK